MDHVVKENPPGILGEFPFHPFYPTLLAPKLIPTPKITNPLTLTSKPLIPGAQPPCRSNDSIDRACMVVLMDPLSPVELEALYYIEEYWLDKREFPARLLLRKRVPEFDLDDALKKLSFQIALNARGIHYKENGDLTDQQVAAIATVTNWSDRRSRNAKLHGLGITAAMWNGWLRNPSFKRLLHKVAADGFDSEDITAQEGLTKAMARGDTSAIKFYMELTGRYRPGADANTQNLMQVVSLIVESIQRHVKDPEVFAAIASDCDSIMNGKGLPQKSNLVLDNI